MAINFDDELPFAVGLDNAGNSCFSSALIQALITLPNIKYHIMNLCSSNTSDLISQYTQKMKKEDMRNLEIIKLCEIFRIMNQLPSNEERKAYKNKYANKIKELQNQNRQFFNVMNYHDFNEKPGYQQDSGELLRYIFNNINESNITFKNEYEYLYTIFRECVNCKISKPIICNNKLKNGEEYVYSDICLRYDWDNHHGNPSLNFNELIQLKTTKKIIEKNDTFERPCNCNINGQITVEDREVIYNIHDTIIICINRTGGWIQQEQKGVKNITTIKKPSVKNLEITKYDFAAKKSIYKYDLVSAVLHVGEQTNGGHYYSIAKRQSEENRNNSEWYVLNDTNVTPLTGTKIYANDGVSSLNLTTIDDCVKSNIFLSQVMLLFYQRQI